MTRPHAHSIPHALLLALLLAVPTALANGSSPQTPAIKSPSTLFTDEQWTKLNGYCDKYEGSGNPFDQQVSNFLGLTRPGETLTVQQVVDNKPGDRDHRHYFIRIGPIPDHYVFTYYDKLAPIYYGYLTDRNLHYLRGYVSTTGTPVALSPEEGEAGFTAEVHLWAKLMDNAPNP